MNKSDSEEFEKFLKTETQLVKNFQISQLLGSQDLNDHSKRRIQKGFENYQAAHDHPFNDEMPAAYAVGDVAVGQYLLNPNILVKTDFQPHICGPGSTNSGKTNCDMVMLHQIQNQYPNTDLRFIVFASKLGCEQRNLIINNPVGTAYYLDKTILTINPLSPIANVDFNMVISDFCRTVSTELGTQPGSQLYLQQCIFEFISNNKDGNFIEFIEWLAKKKEYSYDFKGYRDRLLIRLTSILFEIKSLFDCYRGIPDNIFIEENLVIEIPGSSAFVFSLIVGTILMRVFRFKAANREYLKYKGIYIFEDVQGGLR